MPLLIVISTYTLISYIFSGMNQFYLAAGSTVLLVCGSTVAYAKYDESGNFRNNVEKYVPGSTAVFKLFLGAK